MKNTLLAPPVVSQIDKSSEEFAKYKEAMLERLDGIEDLLDYVELGAVCTTMRDWRLEEKCQLETGLLILLIQILPF